MNHVPWGDIRHDNLSTTFRTSCDMNQHHMYIKSHALCTLMHIWVETVDVADRRSCLFYTSYISVDLWCQWMITHYLLFLVLQELNVVLVTLLPLASFNNSKDDRSYVSKGLKVPPIFKSFIYDHFGFSKISVNAPSVWSFQIHAPTLRLDKYKWWPKGSCSWAFVINKRTQDILKLTVARLQTFFNFWKILMWLITSGEVILYLHCCILDECLKIFTAHVLMFTCL
jgi:hypothetical protein